MADPSDQWELELIKVQELDPTFKGACGNKIKADRRFYRYKGKKGNKKKKANKEVPTFTYCPAIRPDWSVFGNWTAGAFVYSEEYDKINQNLPKPSQKLFRPTKIVNPFTAQSISFGQNPLMIKMKDLTTGDDEDLKNNLEACFKTQILKEQYSKEQNPLMIKKKALQTGNDRDLKDNPKKYSQKQNGERAQQQAQQQASLVLALWNPVDASSSEFTLETESDVLDPDDNLFVRLDATSTSAFGFSAGDVYIQSSTMKALIKDSDAFFSKKDNIAARNNAGDPISLDVANIANALSVMSNTKKWADVFRSSTGAGSYMPPRALNPQICIFLEWTKAHLEYAEFKTLVDGVLKKERSNQSKINTTVAIFEEGKKSLENRFFKLGECPFGGYNTWVSHDTFKKFRLQRSERAIPDKSAIQRAQNNIPATVKQQRSIPDRVNALRQQVYRDKDRGHLIKEDYVLMQSKVSARSMAGTEASPRNTFPDQGDVWGSRSASQVAEDLGWKEDPTVTSWANSGLGDPEWLHRAAYSWGGIVYNKPGTSQIPENLVFGTYETNSIMTRYESVWQELLRILGAVDNKSFALLTSKNPMQGDVPYLKQGDVRYLKQCANEWSYKEFKKDESQWQPWLCYKLDYKLELRNCSNKYDWAKYLDGCFFPFQRLFFTSVEAEIDKAILKFLCNE